MYIGWEHETISKMIVLSMHIYFSTSFLCFKLLQAHNKNHNNSYYKLIKKLQINSNKT